MTALARLIPFIDGDWSVDRTLAAFVNVIFPVMVVGLFILQKAWKACAVVVPVSVAKLGRNVLTKAAMFIRVAMWVWLYILKQASYSADRGQ